MIPTICPACCQELPPGYPYDHVAIDQALAGRRLLHGDELAEAIRVAARRGLTHFDISRRLHVGYTTIDAALGLPALYGPGGRPRTGVTA
jgi:hypothetical protein